MNVLVSSLKNDQDSYLFEVRVEESLSSSRHLVTMPLEFYDDLNTEIAPEEIIKNTFYFLLDREPKEMILEEFNIEVVSKYFPEYKDYLKIITD